MASLICRDAEPGISAARDENVPAVVNGVIYRVGFDEEAEGEDIVQSTSLSLYWILEGFGGDLRVRLNLL